MKLIDESMCLLRIKAVHDIGGHDKVERVRIHFSVSKGYYCTVDGEITVNAEFLSRVDARMREMAEQKIQIKEVDTDFKSDRTVS